MKSIRKIIFLVVSICAIGSSISELVAQEVRVCEHNNWRGNSTNIVISWLGNGFEANVRTGEIKVFYSNGQSAVFKTSMSRASSFTSFNYNEQTRDSMNNRLSNRYSFRVYDDGRCRALLEPQGFQHMVAEGRLR